MKKYWEGHTLQKFIFGDIADKEILKLGVKHIRKID